MMDSGGTAPDYKLHLALRAARRKGDVETLLSGLKNSTEAPFAARFLAEIGSRDSAAAIAPLLSAESAHTRAAAVDALGTLQHVEALPQILHLAETDPAASVRAMAAIAACKTADIALVRPMLLVLLHDTNWQPRRVAAQLLGRWGSNGDVPSIRTAQESESWWRRGAYRDAIRKIRRRSKGSSEASG